MKAGGAGSFGAQLKALREAAGFTQEELATIAGLSVQAVSALERGERRRPHVETVRALSAALDLTGPTRDAFMASARPPVHAPTVEEPNSASLPLPLTGLLGRETDVQTLRRWLADPAARLITLTGPGGVGKTRLALEMAHITAEEGSTRVEFVALTAIRDPAFVAPAIAEALGLADVAADELPKRARGACEKRPTLIVLDNFEQVLEAAPLVVDLLTAAASLRLLVTSRAPLRVGGEREYLVGPLALEVDAQATSPANPARPPAVQLFVERVRSAQPDFLLTSANGPTVAAICRRLDALPLALELAAPWMKVLTPEGLLRLLDRDILLLSGGQRDLPERQQTMNATVAWSYQLLDRNEQRAFRRFGALPGPFPLEAASEVLAGGPAPAGTDEALHAVARLIDKSLLRRVEAPPAGTDEAHHAVARLGDKGLHRRAESPALAARPLYSMLETVRSYAALQLTAANERDDALEGLVRYCTAEAALAASGLPGPAQAEWLDRVHQDLESYRAVLTRLIERGRADEACDVAWGLLFYWLIRGQAEGLRWYEQTLGLQSLSCRAECRSLFAAALMYFNQGDIERARDRIARALPLAHAAGDPEVEARLDDLAARVEHARGHVNRAIDRFAHAVERFHGLAIPWGTGNALIGMARAVLATGDVERAERLLDEATSNIRHAGPWFLSRALYVRAILAVRRGNADEAIARIRETLTRNQELGDRYAFAYVLVPLAAAAALKGDDASAAKILGLRDAVSEQTGATVILQLVHDLREQAEREVRARLGPGRWARAYAAGRNAASVDSMLKDLETVRA